MLGTLIWDCYSIRQLYSLRFHTGGSMQAFLMKVKIIHDPLDFDDVSSHILEEESTPVAQGKGKSLLIQSQIRL